MKDLYEADLLNRFSGYSFTETTDNGMTLVEFKDGSSNVVARAKKITLDDAYKAIRNSILDGNGVIPESTAAERATMSNIMEGARTWDLDTSVIMVYEGGSWS